MERHLEYPLTDVKESVMESVYQGLKADGKHRRESEARLRNTAVAVY